MKKKSIIFIAFTVFIAISAMPFDSHGALILYEDFNTPDAIDDWIDGSQGGTQWSIDIDNGYLVSDFPINAAGTGYLTYSSMLSLPDYYEVSFDVKLEISGYTGWGSGSDHANFQFKDGFGSKSWSSGWRQNECNDFFFTSPLTATILQSYQFDETQWHNIHIVKDGGTISTFLNDSFVYSVTVAGLEGPASGVATLFSSDGKYYYDNFSISSPVPEPATMLLLGSGLVGLAGFRRKRRK